MSQTMFHMRQSLVRTAPPFTATGPCATRPADGRQNRRGSMRGRFVVRSSTKLRPSPAPHRGYNKDGKLFRRFEVISAQKIDGQWMLKQMRMETLAPEIRKICNRTYLEVLEKTHAQDSH